MRPHAGMPRVAGAPVTSHFRIVALSAHRLAEHTSRGQRRLTARPQEHWRGAGNGTTEAKSMTDLAPRLASCRGNDDLLTPRRDLCRNGADGGSSPRYWRRRDGDNPP